VGTWRQKNGKRRKLESKGFVLPWGLTYERGHREAPFSLTNMLLYCNCSKAEGRSALDKT